MGCLVRSIWNLRSINKNDQSIKQIDLNMQVHYFVDKKLQIFGPLNFFCKCKFSCMCLCHHVKLDKTMNEVMSLPIIVSTSTSIMSSQVEGGRVNPTIYLGVKWRDYILVNVHVDYNTLVDMLVDYKIKSFEKNWTIRSFSMENMIFL